MTATLKPLARALSSTFLFVAALSFASLSTTSAHAWIATTTGTGLGGLIVDTVADIAAHPDGGVVVVGTVKDYYPGFIESNILIGRYDAAGNPVWLYQYPSAAEPTQDGGERVAIDAAGNVFAGGHKYSTVDALYHGFLYKIDGSNGDVIWGVHFSTPASPSLYVRDLAVDDDGNPTIAYASTSGQFRAFKIDGDNPAVDLWSYTEPTSSAGESHDVELDSAGNALVSGTIYAPSPQGVVAKLDGTTGTEIWKNTTLLPAGAMSHQYYATSASLLVVASDDDAVVAGDVAGGGTLVARLDASDGLPVWQETIPDFAPVSIASDDTGTLYVAGFPYGPVYQATMHAIDIDTGDILWSHNYGDGLAHDVAVAGNGLPSISAYMHYYAPLSHVRFNVIAADPTDGDEVWRADVPGNGVGNCIVGTADGDVAAGGYTVAPSGAYDDAYATTVKLDASTGAFTECGNGIPELGEECDDGNNVGGDCCASDCTYESSGAACEDGSTCTSPDTCDGAGFCVGGAVLDCDDGNPCTQDSCGAGCINAPVPALSCNAAPKSSFQVKNNDDETKRQIKWKWGGGSAVEQDDLGNPQSTTTYTLCVYDSTAGVDAWVGSLRIDPNALWVDKDPKGWSYKDTTGAEDGVSKAQLKTGAAGKPKAQVGAKGANIPMPPPISGTQYFDQDSRVTVQLFNDTTPTCWSSAFTGASVNDGTQFKAKTP